LTLKPGQKGTKKLLRRYGDKLVCVRYRYDEQKRKRYKTVELVVEEVDWEPRKVPVSPLDGVVYVKINWGERDMGIKVKRAGGVWNPERQVWELAYERVQALGLTGRIVGQKRKVGRSG
jgi:hypothetical protein